MSGISTMNSVVSALMANKAALNTTAHNLTNVNTEGYVRQQILMKESSYDTVGHSGTAYMSIGLGTDIDVIRQVRNIFLDNSYRAENGRQQFYAAHANAIEEIETILGEVEGETFNEILNDLWISMNEVEKHPDGLETRAALVQSASKFAKRANLVQSSIIEYQKNIDSDIKSAVDRINELGQGISDLNLSIRRAELTGANANDFRDSRNALLDELGGLINIKYREIEDGTVLVSAENTQFVIKEGFYKMGTTQATSFSSLREPYWPHLDQKVFNENAPISTKNNNDVGYLKGLTLVRGSRKTNYMDLASETSYKAIDHSNVMVAMATFDKLVHEVVTLVNDRLAPLDGGSPQQLDPNAPFGLNGTQGHELFSRRFIPRFDASGNYIEEDPSNPDTLYSAGNLIINEDVLNDYNLIPLSVSNGSDGDTTVIKSIIDAWGEKRMSLKPGETSVLNVRDFYTAFIGDLGANGSLATNEVKNQSLLVMQIDNQREQLTGVSSDEELGNMMKYQHAYNAASRLVSVLDSMMDKVVNNLGLVGR